MSRIADWWRANAPRRETFENSRILAPVAHRVLAPELWRFTRRSVPRGVALGLFVGILLLIPGVQIAGAAMLALTFRANIPIAAGMTFLSNPATTPFILWLSVYLGNWMLGRTADVAQFMVLVHEHASVSRWTTWLVSDAAPALVVGLFLISVVSAVVGYIVAIAVWRSLMARKWHSRKIRVGNDTLSGSMKRDAA